MQFELAAISGLKSHDCACSGALARPALADDSKGATALDPHVNIDQRAHRPAHGRAEQDVLLASAAVELSQIFSVKYRRGIVGLGL